MSTTKVYTTISKQVSMLSRNFKMVSLPFVWEISRQKTLRPYGALVGRAVSSRLSIFWSKSKKNSSITQPLKVNSFWDIVLFEISYMTVRRFSAYSTLLRLSMYGLNIQKKKSLFNKLSWVRSESIEEPVITQDWSIPKVSSDEDLKGQSIKMSVYVVLRVH